MKCRFDIHFVHMTIFFFFFDNSENIVVLHNSYAQYIQYVINQKESVLNRNNRQEVDLVHTSN